MNLGKLLVAGKSIINGRAAVAYRANKHVYLPKFGVNPFSTPAGTDAKPKPTRMAAKTQKIPPWPSVPAPKPSAPAPASDRTSTWASRLNPISRWREAHAAPESPQPAVQSELSLDSVKVVHNDLSDADVEVVPIKSRTPAAPPVPVLAPPERSWEFLAERMFRA